MFLHNKNRLTVNDRSKVKTTILREKTFNLTPKIGTTHKYLTTFTFPTLHGVIFHRIGTIVQNTTAKVSFW